MLEKRGHRLLLQAIGTPPRDFTGKQWCLRLLADEIVYRLKRQALYEMAYERKGPSRDLTLTPPAEAAAVASLNILDGVLTGEEQLRALAKILGLNPSQCQAVRVSAMHRIFLLHGPPGTGKNTPCAAILSVQNNPRLAETGAP